MEAGGNGNLFGQAFQDRNEVENRVQIGVNISLRVVDERGFKETYGEGKVSRKQLNCGTGIDQM